MHRCRDPRGRFWVAPNTSFLYGGHTVTTHRQVYGLARGCTPPFPKFPITLHPRSWSCSDPWLVTATLPFGT